MTGTGTTIIRTVGQAVQARALVSVMPADSVAEACATLDRENVGCLAVLEEGRLVGVFSERDVIRRVVVKGRAPEETRVAEVMTADPQTVGRDTSLVIAMDLMTRGGFRHLPVEDDGIVFGMLSMRGIPAHYRLLYERYEAAFDELDRLSAMGVDRYGKATPA